ncbi:MAG: hypothetical protein LBT04_05235 [Prevotellaceae bacterium]|jgi:hypothetical protein|nr:hypothetical protein [Prevotellaceae bacterium]
MKIYKISVTAMLFLFATAALGQEKVEFHPSGKVIARSFFDFGQGFDEAKNETGFDISQAFLGYSYQFLPSWSATLIIDGASGNTAGKIEPYIRNAFVNYKNKGFDLNVGMAGLYQFAAQETYWKYRYVQKTFQDLNKMGNSVDMGIMAAYKFSDFLLIDATASNGEGYKKVVRNGSTRIAAGVSVFPVKNLIIRAYGDIYNESEEMRDNLPTGIATADYTAQKMLSFFTGYQNDAVSGGVEFAKLFNKGFIKGKNTYGVSAFVSGKVADKWRIFGRYDWLKSENPANFTANWNDLDGRMAILGAEFQPFKQLKIAPNFRLTKPENAKTKPYLFVNFEFNL